MDNSEDSTGTGDSTPNKTIWGKMKDLKTHAAEAAFNEKVYWDSLINRLASCKRRIIGYTSCRYSAERVRAGKDVIVSNSYIIASS